MIDYGSLHVADVMSVPQETEDKDLDRDNMPIVKSLTILH